MERVTITIRPPATDDGLLRVDDAMQQVLEIIKLLRAAQEKGAPTVERIEWQLERASTNSPFQVVAVAASEFLVDPTVPARHVKARSAEAIRLMMHEGSAPAWMGREAITLARGIFTRGTNGLGTTSIDYGDGVIVAINREGAARGVETLDAVAPLDFDEPIAARVAWGEVKGVMVAAGRYQNRPAIQMRTEQYDFVWCELSEKLIDKFGSAHNMSDIWDGQVIAVEGELHFTAKGKLRIKAADIDLVKEAAHVDLASVLDPEFTSGLDPTEYLRQLHDGDL